MQDDMVSKRTVVAVFGGLAVATALAVGLVVGSMGHGSTPTRLAVSPASHKTHVTSPLPTTVPTPPSTTTTTVDPQIAQQAAQRAAITQDQANVANDQTAVQQDSASIQSLTIQQQTLQGQLTQLRAQEQGQVLQLGNSGQDTAANIAALAPQFQAANAALTNQLSSVVTALNTAESKDGQDQADLAADVTALQVAEDVAATTQG